MTSEPPSTHPFIPYALVEDFLGAAAVDRLLAYACELQPAAQPSSVGPTHRIDLDVRRSSRLGELGPARADFEAKVLALLPGLRATLGLPPFEVRRIETELVAHSHGAFYKRHVDTRTAGPAGQGQRMLSVVYYFHRSPKAFWGGALRLHDPRELARFVDIEANLDRLIAFPAFLPHEVLPIECPSEAFMDSRFAINCWVSR